MNRNSPTAASDSAPVENRLKIDSYSDEILKGRDGRRNFHVTEHIDSDGINDAYKRRNLGHNSNKTA